MRILQNKFLNLPTGGLSFHRAVGEMRNKTAKEEENREKRRKSLTTHLPWLVPLPVFAPDHHPHAPPDPSTLPLYRGFSLSEKVQMCIKFWTSWYFFLLNLRKTLVSTSGGVAYLLTGSEISHDVIGMRDNTENYLIATIEVALT